MTSGGSAAPCWRQPCGQNRLASLRLLQLPAMARANRLCIVWCCGRGVIITSMDMGVQHPQCVTCHHHPSLPPSLGRRRVVVIITIRLGRMTRIRTNLACRVCASRPPLPRTPRLTLITCGRLLLAHSLDCIDAQRCACMQYSVSRWQRGAAAFVCQGSAAGSGGGGAGGGRLLSCRCWPTKEHKCSH